MSGTHRQCVEESRSLLEYAHSIMGSMKVDDYNPEQTRLFQELVSKRQELSQLIRSPDRDEDWWVTADGLRTFISEGLRDFPYPSDQRPGEGTSKE